MRGVNFQTLLKNWDLIIDKLCEEISTHDVLLVIQKNLINKREELNKHGYNLQKIDMAIVKINQVLNLIDPEHF
jgi:broad-specificity NMP kinase